MPSLNNLMENLDLSGVGGGEGGASASHHAEGLNYCLGLLFNRHVIDSFNENKHGGIIIPTWNKVSIVNIYVPRT